MISTMRACIEDERMNVEREFKNGLQKANRYEISKGKIESLSRTKFAFDIQSGSKIISANEFSKRRRL